MTVEYDTERGTHTGILAAAEAASPVESVDVVARELKRRFGATSVSFLITDLARQSVVRMSTAGEMGAGESTETVPLFGTVYGDVIRTQRLRLADSVDGDGGQRVIVPVTNRGDSIGVLEVRVPAGPDRRTLREISRAAHTLAYIVIANQRFTDLYQWGQRTAPLSLAAEIQHNLLPSSLSCEAAQFAVAGALEPAGNVGGDTFDYALDRDTLHLSVTDAMGHEVNAAMLATLLVGALRGARRAGCDLAEQARRAHRAMVDHSGGAMATGLLLRVGLRDGRVALVNAGHPWPLLLRDGRVEEVGLKVNLPFGVPSQRLYEVQVMELRPGDRLVILTDGMLDRRSRLVDLPALLKDTQQLHPREATQILTMAVLDANRGELKDDATVMCLDWYGPEPVRRDAQTGASLTQASPSLFPRPRG
ncbi:serine/threonine-protein phosphatase [Streptomyces verrucosisporus]|uniref:PP2C family protein-serine/threonine phosphatase n=1 Tax=Streptomyces verrucosisporus TaxID=1695161 RepID=UPI0019D2E139|nr:PP2C family protein-serine/threonine phosphatase [Streptomyces verrucosisporus]MBN3930285.1 serine/threonine-protein phosphatase [Streptomyces verrucosisporus]